ncbi:MAG: ATP-binding protein [Gemmatimonadota bacterium]
MGLRELSIRAKVAITILGALLVVLGVASTMSLRYWEQEQFALTSEHALIMAGSARNPIQAAIAHGQARWAREQLEALASKTPFEGFRIVGRDGTVLMSSRPEEEGQRRPGAALPDPWDIPPDGLVVGGRGEEVYSAVVSLSGVGGIGARADLELPIAAGRIEAAIRRGRTFGLMLTAVLGIGYAIVLGAMMEREVIRPYRTLEKQVETQRRELTERAGFAQVGELASQVAHEIKRPLAGIKSAIELIGQEYAISDAERNLLVRVESELTHVDETLRDMLSLARPVGLAPKPMVLHDTINAALARLAGRPAMERVAVVRDYDPKVGQILGDAARLEQAVLNLCLNAVEAMPEGGRVTVTTRAGEGTVAIEVADTGIGIPPENLAKILTPFFSTKALGTGLGLPLVARVVAAHGGTVSVESEVGKGTAFHLEIPAKEAAWQVSAS